MVRTARIVAEGLPHHVFQRGNRRQVVFFEDEDRRAYLRLLKDKCVEHGVDVWAYCLMDNHVHLILVPVRMESLHLAVGEAHKMYTRMINFRYGWRGYLWQGRFHSFVLQERHLYAAMRYVERNPVRAGIAVRAEEYPWSSARAHVCRVNDPVLTRCYMEDEIQDWREYLDGRELAEALSLMRRHGSTGRPLGDSDFLERLAKKLGVDLGEKRPGRPRKQGCA
ncbi:MAG: transposase [Candidatus Omnitrophica bacterium]|nr:transposase [Candidatus Omnitrophota bacterium]